MWLSVDPATGRANGITGTPVAADPFRNGLRYQNAAPGALYCQSGFAAPINSPRIGGIARDDEGVMYVLLEQTPPTAYYNDGGILTDALGTVYGTLTNPIANYISGVPVDNAGRICFTPSGFGPVAIFDAPLTTTLVPVRAGDPTFTFTRATTAYVADHEGILRNAISGEARFQGARRVRNCLQVSSEILTAAGGWTVTNVTSVVGATDPLGGTSAYTVTATGAGGTLYNGMSTGQYRPGEIVVNSAWIRRRTGTGPVAFRTANNTDVDITSQLTSSWQRFAALGVPLPTITAFLVFLIQTSGDAIDVWHPQSEEVGGASNTAPSEYVSVGVLAAPYNGAGVDGVKYFGTTNGNSVPSNLMLQSQAFDVAPWVLQAATLVANNAAAPDSTLTADTLTTTGNLGNNLQQNVTSVSGTRYTFSVYVKGTLGQQIYLHIENTVGDVQKLVTFDGTWQRVSVTGVSNSTVATVALEIYGRTAGGHLPNVTFSVWGAQLEANGVAGPYVPTTTAAITTNVVTEAAGTAIPAATLLGYVAENQATNTVFQSQTFEASEWSGGGAANYTITPNNIAAPDGSLTADRFADTATNAVHNIQIPPNGGTPAPAGTYTWSIYAKAGTLTWMQLLSYDGSNLKWANFNLVTGAVGNKSGGITTSVQALPNGWFRFGVTWTAAVTTLSVYCYSSQTDYNGPSPAYVGTGQTMYLWGAQVEAASDASSYIPTTTASVTRNTDSLTYNPAGNINGAVGSAIAEAMTAAVAIAADRAIVSMGASSYQLARRQGGNLLAMFDTSGLLLSASGITPGTSFKCGSRWGATGAQMGIVLNGGALANGGFDGLMDGTPLTVGNWPGGAWSGTIKNVKVYATALTDAQLQALTT